MSRSANGAQSSHNVWTDYAVLGCKQLFSPSPQFCSSPLHWREVWSTEASLSSAQQIFWTAVFPYDKKLQSQILQFLPSIPQMRQTSGRKQSQKAKSLSCQCVIIITCWCKIDPELLSVLMELRRKSRSWVNSICAPMTSFCGQRGSSCRGLGRCCCPCMPSKNWMEQCKATGIAAHLRAV